MERRSLQSAGAMIYGEVLSVLGDRLLPPLQERPIDPKCVRVSVFGANMSSCGRGLGSSPLCFGGLPDSVNL